MANGGRGEMTDEARNTLSKSSNVFLPSNILHAGGMALIQAQNKSATAISAKVYIRHEPESSYQGRRALDAVGGPWVVPTRRTGLRHPCGICTDKPLHSKDWALISGNSTHRLL